MVKSILPSIFFCSSSSVSWEVLETIPAVMGREVGYTLDRLPVCFRAQKKPVWTMVLLMRTERSGGVAKRCTNPLHTRKIQQWVIMWLILIVKQFHSDWGLTIPPISRYMQQQGQSQLVWPTTTESPQGWVFSPLLYACTVRPITESLSVPAFCNGLLHFHKKCIDIKNSSDV